MKKSEWPTFDQGLYLVIGMGLGAVFHWGVSLGCGRAIGNPWDALSTLGTLATAVIAGRALWAWRHELDDKIAHDAKVAVAILCDGLREVRDSLDRAGEFNDPGITGAPYLDELATLLATPERSNRLREAIAAARVRFGKSVDPLMRRVLLLDNGTFNKLGALKSLGKQPSAGAKDYAGAIKPLSRLSDDADKLEADLNEAFARLIGKAL